MRGGQRRGEEEESRISRYRRRISGRLRIWGKAVP